MGVDLHHLVELQRLRAYPLVALAAKQLLELVDPLTRGVGVDTELLKLRVAELRNALQAGEVE